MVTSRLPGGVPATGQRRLRLAGVAVLVSGLLFAADAQRARALSPPGEYEVKAAFLVNFAEFVHWPAAAFADPSAPFVLCIAGDDPFGAAFEPFRQNKIAGRALLVHRVGSSANLRGGCHTLFVAGSEKPHLPALLGAMGKEAVLTVSDLEDFTGEGGMIQFHVTDNKIRFEINQAAAAASGLKIDARLLKLSSPARGSAPEARR